MSRGELPLDEIEEQTESVSLANVAASSLEARQDTTGDFEPHSADCVRYYRHPLRQSHFASEKTSGTHAAYATTRFPAEAFVQLSGNSGDVRNFETSILHLILPYLGVEHMSILARVCTRWWHCLGDEELWRGCFVQSFSRKTSFSAVAERGAVDENGGALRVYSAGSGLKADGGSSECTQRYRDIVLLRRRDGFGARCIASERRWMLFCLQEWFGDKVVDAFWQDHRCGGIEEVVVATPGSEVAHHKAARKPIKRVNFLSEASHDYGDIRAPLLFSNIVPRSGKHGEGQCAQLPGLEHEYQVDENAFFPIEFPHGVEYESSYAHSQVRMRWRDYVDLFLGMTSGHTQSASSENHHEGSGGFSDGASQKLLPILFEPNVLRFLESEESVARINIGGCGLGGDPDADPPHTDEDESETGSSSDDSTAAPAGDRLQRVCGSDASSRRQRRRRKRRRLNDVASCVPAYREPDLLACAVRRAVRSVSSGAIRSFENRWVVVQPAGTGFAWHVDPYGTCAWNVLLHGGPKRWWFSKEKPVTSNAESGTNAGTAANHSVQTCMQLPGEGIFIPPNTWHRTVSEGETIAFTQNMCFAKHVRGVDAGLRRVPEYEILAEKLREAYLESRR